MRLVWWWWRSLLQTRVRRPNPSAYGRVGPVVCFEGGRRLWGFTLRVQRGFPAAGVPSLLALARVVVRVSPVWAHAEAVPCFLPRDLPRLLFFLSEPFSSDELDEQEDCRPEVFERGRVLLRSFLWGRVRLGRRRCEKRDRLLCRPRFFLFFRSLSFSSDLLLLLNTSAS